MRFLLRNERPAVYIDSGDLLSRTDVRDLRFLSESILSGVEGFEVTEEIGATQ